jgi:hypothetical protein
MKTQATTHLIAVVSALTLSALGITGANAETNALIYNNRAYVQDIGYAPNPAPARKVEDAKIVFVNMAYGPAIYSYPHNVNHQVTAFNVEYVDMAYGPAIYSYPNNNPKHHLGVDNSEGTDRNVVAAAQDGLGYGNNR